MAVLAFLSFLGAVGLASAAVPANAQGLPPSPPASEAAADGEEAGRTLPEAQGDLGVEAFNNQDWLVLQDKAPLLEIHGSFRFRTYWLNNLDLGNNTQTEPVTDGALPRYPGKGGKANYAATSMRLRLEPKLQINDNMQLYGILDVFDNFNLGSTPETALHGTAGAPLPIISRSQTWPRPGLNTIRPALTIKNAWARIGQLNDYLEFRLGRMPDHFGLGIYFNDGFGLDADYGTTADRISATARFFDHFVGLMVDWIHTGAERYPFGQLDAAPLNATSADNVTQWALRLTKEDAPQDLADKLAAGQFVLNYGGHLSWRRQDVVFDRSVYPGAAEAQPITAEQARKAFEAATPPSQRANANLYLMDGYLTYRRAGFMLGTEALLQLTNFGNTYYLNSGSSSTTFAALAALEARYQFARELSGLHLSFKSGVASGDKSPGFGALDRQSRHLTLPTSKNLWAAQFSPDYHLDLILFRRLLGTVTGAWYLRPEVGYNFTESLYGKLWAVYSQSLHTESTPSATGRYPSNPLGVELDAELGYGNNLPRASGQIRAALAGGVLFPLHGLNSATAKPLSEVDNKIPWTIQTRIYLLF